MTEQEHQNRLIDLQADIAGAANALKAFAAGPVRQTADEVGNAFERAGDRIARALGAAALGGEHSFKRLAKTILEELAKIALRRFLPTLGAGLPFFGGKAAGGAVNIGGAYLVGERGPEVFVPRQSGSITQPSSGQVSVHFHFGASADAAAISRHQGQIAAAVARAVAYGRRNL
ncbi:MAG: hypothetical protein JNM59_11620 [Hyphomonadaceae bacterium]|nr:hypothetical protein [Hyphomonadaceae bacterium]